MMNFLRTIAQSDVLDDLVEVTEEASSIGDLLNNSPVFDGAGFFDLLVRFFFNMVVMMIIIHCFYYRKSRRRDFYFTFTLISASIFFLLYLLASVKLKVGFALGLFAIFGIIRYRTESMPVREMTYLFVIISISVINALSSRVNMIELGVTNLIFILIIWILEGNRWLKHVDCKLMIYDKIHLITPDKREEMIADLKERTGLNITKVEIGHIDFMRDTAMIKIYYPAEDQINTINRMTKLPKDNE